jgi:hypothetical protein
MAEGMQDGSPKKIDGLTRGGRTLAQAAVLVETPTGTNDLVHFRR